VEIHPLIGRHMLNTLEAMSLSIKNLSISERYG
jgi:hypothetical protein